jgi:hypothetical protein
MSDASMAAIARNLSEALRAFARERREDDRKQIAVLHAELCAEHRNEIAQAELDAAQPQEPAP